MSAGSAGITDCLVNKRVGDDRSTLKLLNNAANNLYKQETQLSQRGRATLRVVENLAVTQSRSRSFEITPLSRPCASFY